MKSYFRRHLPHIDDYHLKTGGKDRREKKIRLGFTTIWYNRYKSKEHRLTAIIKWVCNYTANGYITIVAYGTLISVIAILGGEDALTSTWGTTVERTFAIVVTYNRSNILHTLTQFFVTSGDSIAQVIIITGHLSVNTH